MVYLWIAGKISGLPGGNPCKHSENIQIHVTSGFQPVRQDLCEALFRHLWPDVCGPRGMYGDNSCDRRQREGNEATPRSERAAEDQKLRHSLPALGIV
ncbi:hypothetical protein GN956_G24592 [Arapaima gigas]